MAVIIVFYAISFNILNWSHAASLLFIFSFSLTIHFFNKLMGTNVHLVVDVIKLYLEEI